MIPEPRQPYPRPEDLVPPEVLEGITRFGGPWTRAKLEAVSHYLQGYTKALCKNPNFHRYYIDAFAGTGICRLKLTEPPAKDRSLFALLGESKEEGQEEQADVIAGSALRAMCVQPRFSHYYFIEDDSHRAGILEGVCSAVLADPSQYSLIIGDANLELRRLIESIAWNQYPFKKAAVFLDPYAVNVEWETLRALFATKSVDVWYLINTATIQRLIRRDPTAMPEGNKATLDRIFGSRDWEHVVYQDDPGEDLANGQQQVLFGDPVPPSTGPKKRLPMLALAKFIAQRARQDLGAWVYPKALPLRNEERAISFCLMFMMANGDPKATGLASRLVKGIFTKRESFDLGD